MHRGIIKCIANAQFVQFVQWSEVEVLIQELQQIEGIQSVTKGRFFRSPGLAPTFQVLTPKLKQDMICWFK